MAAGYAQFSVSQGEPFNFILRAKDADKEPLPITTPSYLTLENGTRFQLTQGQAVNELELEIPSEVVDTIPPDSYKMEVWVTLSGDPFLAIVGRFNVRKRL